MNTLAAAQDLFVLVPALIGVAIVAGLIYAFVYDRRRRIREPAPPAQPPQAQARADAWATPDTAGTHPPVPQGGDQEHYESQHPRPDALPQDGRRRDVHHLKDDGSEGAR